MINPHLLIPGMITAVTSPHIVCKGIKYILSRPDDPCLTCHNGMVVRRYGMWGTVDPVPPRVVFRPLQELERMIERGYSMQFLWPDKAKIQQGQRAADGMVKTIGNDYPELTVARLMILKFWSQYPREIRSRQEFKDRHQWKEWCTLSVRNRWRDEGGDDWSTKSDGREKPNPTPKTAQNRVRSGRLSLVYQVLAGAR